jgi:hypothetical protein
LRQVCEQRGFFASDDALKTELCAGCHTTRLEGLAPNSESVLVEAQLIREDDLFTIEGVGLR